MRLASGVEDIRTWEFDLIERRMSESGIWDLTSACPWPRGLDYEGAPNRWPGSAAPSPFPAPPHASLSRASSIVPVLIELEDSIVPSRCWAQLRAGARGTKIVLETSGRYPDNGPGARLRPPLVRSSHRMNAVPRRRWYRSSRLNGERHTVALPSRRAATSRNPWVVRAREPRMSRCPDRNRDAAHFFRDFFPRQAFAFISPVRGLQTTPADRRGPLFARSRSTMCPAKPPG